MNLTCMLFHFIVSDQVKNWQVNRRKTNRIFDYIIEEWVMKQIAYVDDLYVNRLKI